VVTYDVLTALKRLALPTEPLATRPKRLRFPTFYHEALLNPVIRFIQTMLE
jgi:hypothetical protein